MGAALDEGKVIPKNDTSGHGFGRGLERLLELFPAWFNTWEWKDGHYTAYTQDKNKNNPDNYASFKNQGDYTYDNQTQFSQDGNCGLYPKEGCNPEANVYPKPPTVTNIKVNDQSGAVSGSGGILNAILRFNAYADHDQMPIVRLAVDWGDDSDPYVIQGWFRNRKVKCNEMKDLGDGMGKKIHFGDSSDACEEGYYQFTHIYECKGSSDSKWNASKSACVFIPKVQVLDNWGWCNGEDASGNYKGYWNDNAQKECAVEKSEPWTKFSGSIKVTP